MDHGDDPAFDPEPDAVLIGGREDRQLVIADYSPEWPLRFETERARIAGVVGRYRNMNSYAQAKGPVIERILGHAV